MRGLAVGALVILAGPSACGPAVDEPAELASLCGVDGPVRLLELAPNEVVHTSPASLAMSHPVTRYRDRFVAVVHTYADPVDGRGVHDGIVHDEPEPVSSRVVSVDECGADPVELMSQTIWLEVPDDVEYAWIGCGRVDGADGLYRIDPSGETPPLPLGPRGPCPSAFIAGDVVYAFERSADATHGRLVRFDGAGQAEVLIADDVDSATATGTAPSWDPARDGHLLVTLEQGELIDFAVETRTHEAVASGVARSFIDEGGRYLLVKYEGSPMTIELRDRQTAASISATLPDSGDDEPYVDHQAAFATFYVPDHHDPDTSIILSVADGRRVELAGEWHTFEVLPSGALLLARDSDYALFVLDPGSAEPRWLSDDAYPPAYHDGAVVYLDDQLHTQPAFPPTGDRPQAVVRVPVDGSPSSILIAGVFQPLRLGDGRYVGTRGYAGDYHGDLVLYDDDGSIRIIDHDVYWHFARFGDGYQASAHVDSISFIYPVRDPRHERTGLWRAAVEP